MTDTVQVGGCEHLSAADTAKLIRQALAKAFPDYKFRVNSDTYSMGASVNVSWYDGPPAAVVEQVTDGFAGGGFDGMIDMAYNVESWLEPDGTAHIAGSPGTQGSMGVVPEVVASPRSPGARLVSFGADHVFAQRELTPEAKAVIDRKFREKWGEPDWPDYEQQREWNKIASRWLFPPCTFTFTVTHGQSGEVEAEGLPSVTAASKAARALEKARNPRGWRNVTAHRAK